MSKIPKQRREKRELADVIGYTSENIQVFYQVTEVHGCAIPSGIRLFIDLFLKRNDRCFEVFMPHLLLYCDYQIKGFVNIRMPKGVLLAVSEDKQLFTLVTQEELNKDSLLSVQLTKY